MVPCPHRRCRRMSRSDVIGEVGMLNGGMPEGRGSPRTSSMPTGPVTRFVQAAPFSARVGMAPGQKIQA